MQSHISVILDKALSDTALPAEDGYHLINCSAEDFPALLEAAGALRDRHKGRTVTYSRKVFLPVTNLCRDRCSYCTFRKDPRDPDAWTMSPEDIRSWLARAKQQGLQRGPHVFGR